MDRIHEIEFNPLIEITTVNKCSIDCTYCPQEVFQKNYRGIEKLNLSDFKTALSTVPKNIIIAFSGFAEPFLNPNCIDMIEYAHAQGFRIVLFSSLVGLKLDDVDRLKQCNPVLVIHLPDNLGNAKIPITEEYKRVIFSVLINLHVDSFSVMNKDFKNNGRAGLCLDVPSFHRKGPFWCHKLSAPQLVMLPNCDVVLCCMDFGLRHVIGNLISQSYNQVIESQTLRKIRQNTFRWDGDCLCRECLWSSIGRAFRKYLNKI